LELLFNCFYKHLHLQLFLVADQATHHSSLPCPRELLDYHKIGDQIQALDPGLTFKNSFYRLQSMRRITALLSAAAILCLGGGTNAFVLSPSHVQLVSLSRSLEPTALWSAREKEDVSVIPPEITTPALAKLYPAMVENIEKSGNPNIPLGNPEGRQCNILRNMQIQGKLTPEEVTLLKEMGFIFHALEDVYHQLDFEEMIPRLLVAKQEHGSLDIPKKYAPDPELGAYVTGIRRLGKDRVDPNHRQRLDEFGFVWVSSRKCGGKFMNQYREIQQRLQDGASRDEVFDDPEVIKFVRAQKEAYKREVLSETRFEYMSRLLGGKEWYKD
jgi:Helicase associated domain